MNIFDVFHNIERDLNAKVSFLFNHGEDILISFPPYERHRKVIINGTKAEYLELYIPKDNSDIVFLHDIPICKVCTSSEIMLTVNPFFIPEHLLPQYEDHLKQVVLEVLLLRKAKGESIKISENIAQLQKELEKLSAISNYFPKRKPNFFYLPDLRIHENKAYYTVESVEFEDVSFGPFLIKVHLSNFRWEITSDYDYKDYIHPHISPSGDYCLGGYKPMITYAETTKDLTSLLLTLKSFLHSYNPEDAYLNLNDDQNPCEDCQQSPYECITECSHFHELDSYSQEDMMRACYESVDITDCIACESCSYSNGARDECLANSSFCDCLACSCRDICWDHLDLLSSCFDNEPDCESCYHVKYCSFPPFLIFITIYYLLGGYYEAYLNPYELPAGFTSVLLEKD